MNKENFTAMLQVALLHYDGADTCELFKDWQNPQIVKIGKELAENMREFELK